MAFLDQLIRYGALLGKSPSADPLARNARARALVRGQQGAPGTGQRPAPREG